MFSVVQIEQRKKVDDLTLKGTQPSSDPLKTPDHELIM